MDIKKEFVDAVLTGREIEFSYRGKHYFESRNSDSDWYIYCKETKNTQHFLAQHELIKNAILQGSNINEIWEYISIDCIL